MTQLDLPGTTKAPKTITQTLIGRSLFEFQSYLVGSGRTIFINTTYIDDLAVEHKNIFYSFTRRYVRSLLVNVLLVAYVSGVRFDVTFFGNKLLQFPAIVELGVFASAFLLASLVYDFLSYTLVDSILVEICGRQVGYQSPRFVYAHKNATGLWIDVLTPRFVGYASGGAHRFVIAVWMIYFVGTLIAIFVFSYGSVIYAAHHVFFDGKPFGVFKWVVVVAVVNATSAVLFLIVCTIVRFKFEVKDSDIQQQN